MRTKQMLLVTLGCLMLTMTTAAIAEGHHDHALTVGKRGEITLKRSTKVGGTVLQPDTYIVQHRSSGGDHFVRFIELKQEVAHGAEGQFSYTEKDNAGEIKCRMEPSVAPIKETAVYISHGSGGDRITKVVIKGEDFVHLF